MTENILLSNIDKLHTTPLGVKRIRKNLNLPETDDVVLRCREMIRSKNAVTIRNGKNWYVTAYGAVITVNAVSYTIITAHLK